tara:strand:+ start:528 stop:797 length:270 start_codon:yes stop_codon:yes gene_type:complete
MSYHDGYDPRGPIVKDKSKANYYDELNFWINRCKNLQHLLSESRDYVLDYEILLSHVVKKIEGENFDSEHYAEVQKFLRILEQELGDKS